MTIVHVHFFKINATSKVDFPLCGSVFFPKRSFPVIVQSFLLFIAAVHNIDLNASWRTRRVSAWIFDHNSEESLMSCIFSENWSISPTRMNSTWKHSVCMKVTIDRVPFTSNYPYFHQTKPCKDRACFSRTLTGSPLKILTDLKR